MVKFTPYVEGHSIIKYSENFARHSHQGQLRDTGDPVFEGHCLPVAKIIGELIPKGHPYHEIAVCEALTHDSPEKKYRCEVYDEFSATPFIVSGKHYMNFLYAKYEDGDQICYGVNKLTHRKWLEKSHPEYKSYSKYIFDLCRFWYNEEELRKCDTITAIVKDCGDKYDNMDPNELELIIKLEKEGMISPQKRIKIEGKLRRAANSYLTKYGPMFEVFINYVSRKEHGEEFLDWENIRGHMTKTRERAIILSTYPISEIVVTPENMRAFNVFGENAILGEIYKKRFELIKRHIELAQKRKKF